MTAFIFRTLVCIIGVDRAFVLLIWLQKLRPHDED